MSGLVQDGVARLGLVRPGGWGVVGVGPGGLGWGLTGAVLVIGGVGGDWPTRRGEPRARYHPSLRGPRQTAPYLTWPPPRPTPVKPALPSQPASVRPNSKLGHASTRQPSPCPLSLCSPAYVSSAPIGSTHASWLE